MSATTCLTDTRNPLDVSATALKAPGQRTGHPHGRQPAAKACQRRLKPVTVGFWLGGLVLGTAGVIVGARVPYHHPVAVTISSLWWGIYLGSFGASVGGLLGLWKSRT